MPAVNKLALAIAGITSVSSLMSTSHAQDVVLEEITVTSEDVQFKLPRELAQAALSA